MAKSVASRLYLPFLGLTILLISFGFGAFLYLESLTQPLDPNTATPKIFVIKKGQSLDSIGLNLEAQQLIRSAVAFKYIIAKHHLASRIQAGTFRLSPNQDVLSIATELTHGTLDTWVTLLEGWRREEIAASLTTALTAAGSTFNPQAFLSASEGKEGYLFPDTYLIPLDTSETAIVSLLETTFNQKVEDSLKTELALSPRSLEDLVIMASIIEREARSDSSRKIVADILWRRLDQGWPLQVDATLQYIKGYDATKDTWWPNPLATDKNLNSPYNTYAHPGLPPGPICSPSLSSLKAALQPISSGYWYYLTDTQGNMHYAATNDEHVQNINTYLR